MDELGELGKYEFKSRSRGDSESESYEIVVQGRYSIDHAMNSIESYVEESVQDQSSMLNAVADSTIADRLMPLEDT